MNLNTFSMASGLGAKGHIPHFQKRGKGGVQNYDFAPSPFLETT